MNQELNQIKKVAEEYKALYRLGEVSRDEAKKYIMPYIDAFNEKSKSIAKKYGMKPQVISFPKFIR